MAGGIVIAVILVLFPVIVAMSGAVAAAILGAALKTDADRSHAGSELLDVNV